MTKLNLGSKWRRLRGFDNLDKIYGWLFQDGLPQYSDGSVDAITISHALMFLTLPELETFMKEMWRVLKVGGVVRITEDDTEHPRSVTYQTGCVESKPQCLTGPKMMRGMLERAGFTVYDVDQAITHFSDNSLMQAWRGGPPKFFFIEGVKASSPGMKNLLIYTGPDKQFNQEHTVLAKIQIDNSLELGWKREDILLVTDFPYEYNGVKSLVIPDGLYYDFDKPASKIPVIVYLLQQGLLDPRSLYWSHDLDAFELNRIDEQELGLINFDLGLTHYTYKPQWQCGSIFFRQTAKDVFELLDRTTRSKPHSSRNNEKTLTTLINKNAIDISRYKRLNPTYNIMRKYLTTIYREAEKPLKVLHFNPWYNDELSDDTTLDMFMYGKNRLGIRLMDERLIKIFNHHGIK